MNKRSPLTGGGTSRSVILPDVSECLVEEILIFDLVLHGDHLAEGFLHLAFSGIRILLAREANTPDDPIDVGDDPLHDHRGLPIFGFGEQLGQRCLGLVLFVHGIDLLFSLNDLPGQRQQLFQEVQAV